MTLRKTYDLKGAVLAWAIAKCEGQAELNPSFLGSYLSWQYAGPIIDREKITVHCFDSGGMWMGVMFARSSWGVPLKSDKPTPGIFGAFQVTHRCFGISHLEAAMRCYCESKLGTEVDVPEELLDESLGS